jgi:CBS-domain-containing membrane protein
MKKEGIRHLPVTDDTSRLFGIITDRDLRSAAYGPSVTSPSTLSAARAAKALEERVRDAMTWDVVPTHPEVALGHVAGGYSSGDSAAFRCSTARSWWACSPSET